jgi:hypothetical protein
MKKYGFMLGAAVIALSLPLVPAGAAVYKWTDAQGNTHFSDRPDELPAAQRIEVDVVPPSASPPAAPKQRDGGGDAAASGEAGGAAPLQADAEAQRAIREKNCEIARGTRAHNENIDRMYRLGPDGERVFLSDEEREQVLSRSRADVEKWCD